MARSEISLKAYVIDVIQQKEADAIVTFLTEKGMKTAYIRGMMKLKSRNYFLNNRFLNVQITGIDSTKYFKLKEAKILNYPQKQQENYRLYQELIQICKVMNQVPQVLDYASFLIFDYMMKHIELTTVSHYKMLFLVHISNNLGFNFVLNQCAKCQSTTNIINFDLYEGGMLCYNCNQSNKTLTLEELTVINEIYLMQISKTSKREFNPKNMYDLIDFLNHGYGMNIKWE